MALVLPSSTAQLRDGLKRFGSGFTRGQKAVTVAAIVGVIVVAAVFMSMSGKPTYAILFTNLKASDAAAITQQLSSNHVPYQLQDGGSTILVPENQVDQERLAAAQAGLPNQSTVGFSILDKEGLTTSQLTQQADYLQALQGELEQTINSISGVTSSQVNLAMAANQTFVLGNTNPTGASVLVDLAPGHTLSYGQVQAIASLVASSVSGLTTSQVTVADSNGDLLAGPGANNTGGAQSSAEAAYDSSAAARILGYLSGVVGAGNADVQVDAQLDFDQVQTSTQGFVNGPNGKPLTTCTSTQSTTTKYTGSGTPPGSSLSGSGAGTYTQTSKQNSCEAGTQSQTIVQAPGTLKSQSVAVLINSHALPKGVALASLRAGIAAAAGINTARGDVLSLNTAPFASTATPAAKTSKLAGEIKPALAVLLLIICLVLLMLGSRKAKRRAASAFEHTYDELLATPALEGAGANLALGRGSNPNLQSIVDNQPEEVARILSSWLAESK